MLSSRERTAIIAVVTGVWVFNVVGGTFIDSYEPTESINGIFMAIIGGVFVAGRKSDKEGGDDG